MAKCPKCDKGIDELIYSSKTATTQYYSGDGDYSVMEFGDHYDDEYICPQCLKIVAKTEDEADKIVKGVT